MTLLHRCAAGLAVAIAFGVTAVPAGAQGVSPGKWEIEVHGGGIWPSSPTDGSAGTLPAGTAFTTAFGNASRRESTWLAGDGTTLLNDVNAALRANGRVTSLDAVLTSAAATRDSGGSFGFRVARRIASRYAAEFAFDYAQTPLTFTQKTLDGIEATRSSFVTAFKGLLATGPFLNSNVAATTDLQKGSGHQLITTGVLTADLVTRGRVIPYVEGGGGVIANGGDDPRATLTSTYSFSIGSVVPINETDRIAVRVVDRGSSAVGVFGGGVRFAASPRWGVRADVRATIGGGKTDTRFDATPSSTPGTPAGFIASATTPSVQFSTVTGASIPTNLSGPAISNSQTFSTSGTAVRTSLVGGLYFRF